MHNVKAITIRYVDPDLARALQAEKRRRGTSLNQTVLDLLRHGLGVDADDGRSNGLGELAGTWSDAELAEFEEATAVFEQVDEELWS
jgi:hypothetical protein